MKQLRTIATAVTVAGAWFAMSASAQDANYDETRVPAYTLPELFGDTGSDPKAWRTRRSELLRLFEGPRVWPGARSSLQDHGAAAASRRERA